MMEILTSLTMLAGLALWLIGSLWLLAVAFRANPALGLACLCIPCFDFVFAFQNRNDAGKPFLLSLAGRVLFLIAFSCLPDAN